MNQSCQNDRLQGTKWKIRLDHLSVHLNTPNEVYIGIPCCIPESPMFMCLCLQWRNHLLTLFSCAVLRHILYVITESFENSKNTLMCRMDAHSRTQTHTHAANAATHRIYIHIQRHPLTVSTVAFDVLSVPIVLHFYGDESTEHTCVYAAQWDAQNPQLSYKSACWLQLGRSVSMNSTQNTNIHLKHRQIFIRTSAIALNKWKWMWKHSTQTRLLWSHNSIESIRNEINDFLHHHHFTIRSNTFRVRSLIVSNIHRRTVDWSFMESH